MIAGKFDTRITLLRPLTVTNRFGEETPEFEETKTVWAERVKMSGSRHDEVAEHFADYRAEYHIRDAHEVGNNWHIKELNGYEYVVVAWVPNRRRGMKTLICERLNP